MPYVQRSYGLQWVKPMPRVPEVIINSVVYLYRDIDEAESGTDIGGSGFLVGFPSESNKGCSHLYVVTCAHVVHGGSTVVRVNLKHSSRGYEKTFPLDFAKEDWICHPEHDIAVCALRHDADIRNYDISVLALEDFILTKKQVEEQGIGPGDDLLYIGRFMGHAGKYQNMPSVRFGNISMNPNDNEPIDYKDPQTGVQRKQVAFLVEARSRSGYSGSPVFFINEHNKSNPRWLVPMFELRLLGIDFSHIPETVALVDPHGHLHGNKWQVEVHAGMMGVVPSWFLLDFIKTAPDLIEQRRRDDEFYASWSPTAVVDSVSPIVQAPKEDIQPGATVHMIGKDRTISIKFPTGGPSSSITANQNFKDALSKTLSDPRTESENLLDQKQKETEK